MVVVTFPLPWVRHETDGAGFAVGAAVVIASNADETGEIVAVAFINAKSCIETAAVGVDVQGAPHGRLVSKPR